MANRSRAGVTGLTTALLLSKNPEYHVTIVAKHMPGDYDIEYTSPWAGANYLPISDETNNTWEKDTWPELARLAKDVPEAGIHFQGSAIPYLRTHGCNADNDAQIHTYIIARRTPNPQPPNGSMASYQRPLGSKTSSPISASLTRKISRKASTPQQRSHPSASTPPSTYPGSYPNASRTAASSTVQPSRTSHPRHPCTTPARKPLSYSTVPVF
jgi:hypothetical protein